MRRLLTREKKSMSLLGRRREKNQCLSREETAHAPSASLAQKGNFQCYLGHRKNFFTAKNCWKIAQKSILNMGDTPDFRCRQLSKIR